MLPSLYPGPRGSASTHLNGLPFKSRLPAPLHLLSCCLRRSNQIIYCFVFIRSPPFFTLTFNLFFCTVGSLETQCSLQLVECPLGNRIYFSTWRKVPIIARCTLPYRTSLTTHAQRERLQTTHCLRQHSQVNSFKLTAQIINPFEFLHEMLATQLHPNGPVLFNKDLNETSSCINCKTQTEIKHIT